jgi:hypothetical protein
MLRAWQARPEEEISREVHALFASDDREAQAELEALLGQRTL